MATTALHPATPAVRGGLYAWLTTTDHIAQACEACSAAGDGQRFCALERGQVAVNVRHKSPDRHPGRTSSTLR